MFVHSVGRTMLIFREAELKVHNMATTYSEDMCCPSLMNIPSTILVNTLQLQAADIYLRSREAPSALFLRYVYGILSTLLAVFRHPRRFWQTSICSQLPLRTTCQLNSPDLVKRAST